MKTIILPAILVLLGLLVAQYFFDVDIVNLGKGFINFITTILKGPAQ